MSREIKPRYDASIGAMVYDLRIDPEFRDLLGALSDDDRMALADSIAEEGCRDALVAWPQPEGAPILLDGHHRHAICEKMGAAYRVVECPDSVTDRKSALAWIVENQRARRNLTPEEKAYFMAKVYGTAKGERGGDKVSAEAKANCQIGSLVDAPKTAAEKVAAEFGVSPRTIYRSALFADQVDAIAAEHGPEAKADILSGRKKVSDFTPPREPPAVDSPPAAPPPEVPVAKEPSLDSGHGLAPEEERLARIRFLSDGECTLEMARHAVIVPGRDCGATAKPVPLPENASPNYADPEVLKRDGDPFGFAVTEMERHALAAETALTRSPPPDDMRSALIRRLAALEDAIRKLSGSLQGKE